MYGTLFLYLCTALSSSDITLMYECVKINRDSTGGPEDKNAAEEAEKDYSKSGEES